MTIFLQLIKGTVLILFCCLLGACNRKTGTHSEKKNKEKAINKPNILFILSDDLGAHDLSSTGSTFYETPNIDRIANEGTVFTQGYATSRVCSPSRASILNGQFTARHGITDWIGAAHGESWRKQGRNTKLLPPRYKHELSKEDISMAEALRQNGYKTFFAGKWHLGEQGSYPEDHGFSINKGGWTSGSPKGGYFSPWINPKLENMQKGENLSMRLAKETAAFIKAHKDTTFFAMLSFYAVHGPIQTTKEKWEKYREKAINQGVATHGYEMERLLPIRVRQDNPVYAGLVEQMDEAVGVVMQTLQNLDLDRDTIIIFTSDNGGVASGDAFSTTNLPLRGGKGYQWEGGIREPYFIKVPGIGRPGTRVTYPVTGADFYPTILDLINAKMLPSQHLDGKSLKPLLEGNTLPERPLFWHYPHYGNQGGEPTSMVRKGKWKLIYYWENEKEELYDLVSDPTEQKDVAVLNTAIQKQLSTELHRFLREVNANKPKVDPFFDQRMAEEMLQKRKHELLPSLEKQRMKFLEEDFEPNATWWGSFLRD